ncbi:hypothetical protein [Providencia sp. PROV041]|uniref:hypothetical protein n=1 Tax=Providencia sp. PROV041 TaxID=2949772 RepID=UPI00234AB928|nr:hypothetical protein [Providencia sp. PROV041]
MTQRWNRTVHGAMRELLRRANRVRIWRDLWMSPVYAWFRRNVLHREDAFAISVRELHAIDARVERIHRRYFRGSSPQGVKNK